MVNEILGPFKMYLYWPQLTDAFLKDSLAHMCESEKYIPLIRNPIGTAC